MLLSFLTEISTRGQNYAVKWKLLDRHEARIVDHNDLFSKIIFFNNKHGCRHLCFHSTRGLYYQFWFCIVSLGDYKCSNSLKKSYCCNWIANMRVGKASDQSSNPGSQGRVCTLCQLPRLKSRGHYLTHTNTYFKQCAVRKINNKNLSI